MSLIRYIIIPLYFASSALAAGVSVWALRRWWISAPKIELPAWRCYLALGGFGLGELSFLFWFALALWARVMGGLRFGDPVLFRCSGVGVVLGLAGFILSLPGKGKLRWPACFISFAAGLIWLATASMQ